MLRVVLITAASAGLLVTGTMLAPSAFGQNTQTSAELTVSQSAESARRINLAGRQRMLSQRMAKSVCLYSAGVDQTAQLDAARRAHALFDTTLKALISGSETLDLQPETDRNVLKSLSTVSLLWGWYGPSVKAYADAVNEHTRAQVLDNVLTSNLNVLLEMDNAVGLIEKANSAAELPRGLANAINVSGRQRMLSQKMSKEYCMLAVGFEAEETRLNLLGTLTLFETSHRELLARLPDLDISSESREELAQQLAVIDSMWSEFRALVEPATGVPGEQDAKAPSVLGHQPGQEKTFDLDRIAEASDPFLKELNRAVSLYEAASGAGEKTN